MKTYEYRGLRAPRIVAIGGGTGLSNMLRGLKRYTSNLTALVTVTDNGGGSGVLRRELGMLPPGDIRNCMQALANTEDTIKELLAYRFTGGSLEGQSFGNLFLAALGGISDSFEQAVTKMGEVLAVSGRVLPISNELIDIQAELSDGSCVLGETEIVRYCRENGLKINKLKTVPEKPIPVFSCLEAIEQAELIILGPGSLYTSVLPNLLVDGVTEAICRSSAMKIYVCNVMTQPGETSGFSVSDHVETLFRHAGARLFDNCLANSMPIPEEMAARYRSMGASQPVLDKERLTELGVRLHAAPMVSETRGFAWHDSDLLSREILNIYRNESPTKLYGG